MLSFGLFSFQSLFLSLSNICEAVEAAGEAAGEGKKLLQR